MVRPIVHQPDPKLDLVLERIVDVPRELLWRAWTTPELLKQWFTPMPWKTVECEIDLRPGGMFRTVMQSPEGELFPGTGCYLEVIENERLVWTDALLPGFRPAVHQAEGITFTGMILLEPHEQGTKYTAIVLHKDEATQQQHEAMGFREGWGKALDQLLEVVKSL